MLATESFLPEREQKEGPSQTSSDTVQPPAENS